MAGPTAPVRQEKTQVYKTQGHAVLTTTNVVKAMEAIRIMDPKTLLVDNERDPQRNMTNAMTMVNMGTK